MRGDPHLDRAPAEVVAGASVMVSMIGALSPGTTLPVMMATPGFVPAVPASLRVIVGTVVGCPAVMVKPPLDPEK